MPAETPHADLLGRSIVVTGTHYSATTLVGSLLASAPGFNLLHEPLNPEPTLSYDSLKPSRWYEFYDDARYHELADGLAGFLGPRTVIPQTVARLAKSRSGREVQQALRYAQRKLPFLLSSKPVILKDPFLAFSARTLQARLGTKTVLCLRHPGAFAESFLRKAGSFDFRDLASQAPLLAAIPEEREAIERCALEPLPPIEQAALLWRVVYGFADKHYVGNSSTTEVRQEEFIDNAGEVASRLLGFAGARMTASTRRFLDRSFAAGAADMEAGDYIRRDPRLAALKWRDRLSPDEIARLRSMTGTLAARFGYDAESWPY